MADPPPIFPVAEFQRRTCALQTRMGAAGISALLLTAPADIFYVTGFLTRFWESPARPWFVVVPAKGTPIAVIPAIGADLMGRSWIDDIRTWPAPDPADDGVTRLAETLGDLVPAGGRIGLAMGAETGLRMPLADFERVKARLAPRAFIDATDILHRVREVKSEAEIEKIRATCAIAARAFARIPEIVAQTPRLDTVFRRFQMALLDEGADWVSYVAGGAGPGGYGDVISPAAPLPLKNGDVLMLDTGAVRDGYFCDFDRNFAMGTVDAATRRAHAALFAATGAALDRVRPGMLARDAHRIMVQALVQQGHTPGGGRLGHGLGITLTEWPSFTPLDRTKLRAGMVLTLEPSVTIAPGRMLVHEENIVLRADGPELLTPRAPADLPVIGP